MLTVPDAAPRTIAEQRRAARRRRASMSDGERRLASLEIERRILRSAEFVAARRVACYLSTPEEVETSGVIAHAWRVGKSIHAPVIDGRGGMRFVELAPDTRLERNAFGLWEPVDSPAIEPGLLDVVIAPLVAFDDEGHRIGMGGGYFDRCFSFLRHRRRWLKPKLVGAAFACQRVEKIQPNPWDISLYRVISA